MQRWLARFSFSFIVLAAVCFWKGYTIDQRNNPDERAKVILLWSGGGLLLGLGLAGIKARHRQGD